MPNEYRKWEISDDGMTATLTLTIDREEGVDIERAIDDFMDGLLAEEKRRWQEEFQWAR